jgi:hypothetical protein
MIRAKMDGRKHRHNLLLTITNYTNELRAGIYINITRLNIFKVNRREVTQGVLCLGWTSCSKNIVVLMDEV